MTSSEKDWKVWHLLLKHTWSDLPLFYHNNHSESASKNPYISQRTEEAAGRRNTNALKQDKTQTRIWHEWTWQSLWAYENETAEGEFSLQDYRDVSRMSIT